MNNTVISIIKTLVPQWIRNKINESFDRKGLERYSQNTLWALIIKIVSVLVSFFVTIYLVRYLGPEHYGNLSYAVSFVALFSIISSLGIDHILYRELIQHPDKRNIYLGSALAIKLSAGVLACIITIIAAVTLTFNDVSRIIILMLAATFIFNAFNIIIFEFQANVQQKYPSLVSLIVVIILNLLKLVAISLDLGILYIGAILLLESILYALLFSFIRFQHYGSITNWRFDYGVSKSLLLNSWPFIFIALFATIYARIDQVMLKHLLDSSAVGIYDAAVRISEVWLFLPGIIASSLFPAIINAKNSSLHEYKKRLFLLIGFLITLAVAVALPFTLLANTLMTLLYGPAFIESAFVLSIYIWSGVFVSISIVLHYFLIAENLRTIIFLSSFGTMIINVLLNIYLIPIYGVSGAAWATLISYAFLILPSILILKLK